MFPPIFRPRPSGGGGGGGRIAPSESHSVNIYIYVYDAAPLPHPSLQWGSRNPRCRKLHHFMSLHLTRGNFKLEKTFFNKCRSSSDIPHGLAQTPSTGLRHPYFNHCGVFSYAIRSRKVSANEQFFLAQTIVSLLQTTQIETRRVIYSRQQSLHQQK